MMLYLARGNNLSDKVFEHIATELVTIIRQDISHTFVGYTYHDKIKPYDEKILKRSKACMFIIEDPKNIGKGIFEQFTVCKQLKIPTVFVIFYKAHGSDKKHAYVAEGRHVSMFIKGTEDYTNWAKLNWNEGYVRTAFEISDFCDTAYHLLKFIIKDTSQKSVENDSNKKKDKQSEASNDNWDDVLHPFKPEKPAHRLFAGNNVNEAIRLQRVKRAITNRRKVK